MKPKVPDVCPICGSAWQNGTKVPRTEMEYEDVVTYKCGCEITVSAPIIGTNLYKMNIRNCTKATIRMK